MIPYPKNSKGFTAVELLVTIAVSGLLLTSITTAYRTMIRSHVTQEMVVDMQQNVRGAMQIMQREIRMAGFDPTGLSGARILFANDTEIQFQIDENGDGDFLDGANFDDLEVIRYAMTTGNALGRQIGDGLLSPLADNIDAINFVYLDGADPPNVLATPVADPADIRSVQITIVARSGENLPGFFHRHTDDRVYRNQQGDVNLDMSNNPDYFRRWLLTSEARCRNLCLLINN